MSPLVQYDYEYVTQRQLSLQPPFVPVRKVSLGIRSNLQGVDDTLEDGVTAEPGDFFSDFRFQGPTYTCGIFKGLCLILHVIDHLSLERICFGAFLKDGWTTLIRNGRSPERDELFTGNLTV